MHRTPRQGEAATIYSSGNSIRSSSSRGTRLFWAMMLVHNTAHLFYRQGGSAVPTLDLTSATSTELITPFAFTSSRKRSPRLSPTPQPPKMP